MSTASAADAEGEADKALASSLKKTMTIDEEFVVNSMKVSTGRFRARLVENATMKPMRVRRHVEGNERSAGMMGEYHHLNDGLAGIIMEPCRDDLTLHSPV